MLKNSRESISHLANETITQIDSRLDKIEAISSDIMKLYYMEALDKGAFNEFLHEIVYEHNEIVAINISMNPEFDKGADSRTILHKDNSMIVSYAESPDYQYLDWYQIPYLKKTGFWTEPWFDETDSKQFVISHGTPIFKGGKAIGILRIDTGLTYLQSLISPLKLRKSGYAFLISNTGTIITHPADSLIMDESIFSLAEGSKDENLRDIGRQMISGSTNFVRIKGGSILKDSWLYHAPLLSNNWSLGIVIANSDVMRDLNMILIIQVLISIIVFIVISIIVYSRTQNVSKPLRSLSELALQIGKGEFNTPLPEIVKTYEIERLSEAFSAMQASLRDYISNLEKTNLEKNRIMAEVRFAAEIQKNLIPSNTEYPCNRTELRVHGILEPASDIGGDLYDYFMIDDNHFCFAIADVVGKGIVAAMTMTIVSTYLRSISSYHWKAKDIISNLNIFLCKNNIEANFVTILLGVIDLSTGLMEYCNAGHVPMFVRKMDKSYVKYSLTHSTAVGVFDELEIDSEQIQLDMGDEIILFTDGITEAMNAEEDFLGITGLEQIIQNLGTPNPQKNANLILEEVHRFSSTSKEKDDITILVMDYMHPKRLKSI
jgi:sigma-B regulation protein RsbU (phosphoserine phosphatase)